MKKIYALLLGVAVVTMSVVSCSNKDFDEKFYNPSKTTTVTCDKLMSGVFHVGSVTYKGFGFMTYWRLYTWEAVIGQFTQQKGFTNESGGVYYLQDSWCNDRWNNFYETLVQFRKMQDVASQENNADNQIFLDLAEVFILDQLDQVVTVFGPAPYSEAGYLAITGDLASSRPAYESDEALFGMMIDRLGELYNEITSLSISNEVKAKLEKQDFINNGSLDLWARYANTLRLRIATQVAAKGSLTTKAHAAIKECASRKLADTFEPDGTTNGIFGAVGIQTGQGGNFYEWYRDGFCGSDRRNGWASQTVIDAMQITGVDDPRLKIFYHPNAAGDFVGLSIAEDKATQTENLAKGWDERPYASIDSVTFTANSTMKNPIVTPAETWFLLAEAYQQGYANGDPEGAFTEGVKASIYEWYNRNITSSSNIGSTGTNYQATAADIPDEADIEDYAEAVWNEYADPLEAIMTQKWLHLSFMSAHESWNDIRRTGYPELVYRADTQSQQNRSIVQRLLYPTAEKNNNTANYEAATASFNDSNSTVLFWATELK